MSPYSLDPDAEARRLVEGIQDLLPREAAVRAYEPAPGELIGKLVFAREKITGSELLGVLQQRDAELAMYNQSVRPESVEPLTWEDLRTLSAELERSGWNPDPP
jgi:hypothetical protein